MKNRPIIFKLLLLVIGCIALSFSTLADNGVVVKATNYELDDDTGKMVKTGTSTMYISADKILIKQSSDGKNDPSVIFDAVRNEMIIFLNAKEYMVLDEAQMVTIQKQLKSMMEMMEKMKANMTDEQKKLMEKNMPGSGKEGKTIFSSGGKSTINGWSSQKYSAKVGSELISDIFIASYSTVGVSKNDFSAMIKMMTFFQKNLSGLGKQFKMKSDASFMTLGGDNPAFTKGFPVKISSYADGVKTGDTIIDSVDKKTLSSDLFKIPSHMTKKDMNQMFQGGMNR